MVNQLFVASTTRNKMPPKKARVRLRQSEVFFPLAYHAIVAKHVVQQGIFLVLSYTNKHCKFVRQKAESLIKFEPNNLTSLSNGKIEKTTVYLIFTLFSLSFFCDRNQIRLFSSKGYNKLITITGKMLWCPFWLVNCRYFSAERAQYQGNCNPPCFQYASA